MKFKEFFSSEEIIAQNSDKYVAEIVIYKKASLQKAIKMIIVF